MIKRVILASVGMMLGPWLAHGQGVPYSITPPAPGALISVCNFPATGNPCTNTATISGSATLGPALAQPFLIGAGGNLLFYVAPGTYQIQITGRPDVVVTLAGGTNGSLTLKGPLFVGNSAMQAGDSITGILISGSSLQSAQDQVALSLTSVWAPDAVNPPTPFHFGFDTFLACSLGTTNTVVSTNLTACGSFTGNDVVSTSGAGQTVNVLDLVNYVANAPLISGPGTMAVTRNNGYWATNQGNSHVATSYGFRADAQSGSTTNNWGFFSVPTNTDQMGILTVTSMNATAVTVASLPAAAAGNSGQWRTVSDSTAIAAEGQTCAGGGAVKAAAFSNGVNWKCF